MGDAYWNRQAPPMHQSGALLKRPRSDNDLPPSGVPLQHGLSNYLTWDDGHGGHQVVNDTRTLGSAYDRYLQSSQIASLPPREASNYSGVGFARAAGGGGSMPGLQLYDPIVTGRTGARGLDLTLNSRGMGRSGQSPVETTTRTRETLPLPPDATNTLYIEGLPPNSTKREVTHIFRPFVGYREVRLVRKESKHRGGDPLILCFVDFIDAPCAATALAALQGYKMDEDDQDSTHLRLQFSKYPGQRSGTSSRGRR